MSVEYVYDTILMSSGSIEEVCAFITDENEAPITEGCKLILLDIEDELIAESVGVYDAAEQMWRFPFEPEQTEGLRGKFFYGLIEEPDHVLSFQKPFYLL